MKKYRITRYIPGIFFLFVWVACTREPLPEIEEEEVMAGTEAWHDKIRDKPYPDLENGLFINPAPLLVPQKLKTRDYLQFELSRNPGFNSGETLASGNVPWCMFNPHQVLTAGNWYWRFRSVDKNGDSSAWSETIQFYVEPGLPQFVTPKFEEFLANAPRTYPRLYCFLDDGLEDARHNLTSHPEYRRLISRAASALDVSYENEPNPYNHISRIKNYTIFLYQGYHLTQETIYADKMLEFIRTLLAYPINDSQLFSSNFNSTDIALVYVKAYDIARERMTATEKQQTEELIMKIARYYYQIYCGAQENHIFDNHFWQHNMRILFQVAFMLYTENTYAAEAIEMMEYYYELWTARAPDSGFNRDGVWRNGTSYFSVNVKTLYYMPSLYSYVTQTDFLKHPWYQNVGQAITYTWPPDSRSVGFGDGSESEDEPNRLRIAFADFIAREVGDAYAGWYATQCNNTLVEDFEFRLYRMVRTNPYISSSLPENYPKLVWYKDVGEVTIHTDITNLQNDLALSFRSSTFGSGSHTVADQNSFNLLYKGKDIYRSSGYYIDFSGPHNIMSYRHTRAHNTILVNGIGQPFSMKGYGNIVRAIGGDQISYCLGDASNAYCGISDDPMWIKNFQESGITQTSNNGFGTTPLSLYRRHILVLHPDIVVLYDELGANESVRWEWLLHSNEQFAIEESRKVVETNYGNNQFKAVTQIFSDQSFSLSQTDQFVIPPTTTPDPKYPNQWHLTATFTPVSQTRLLTVIQVLPEYGFARSITKNGDTYTCGKWKIKAILNPAQPAGINITNTESNIVFSYGTENPVINNNVYNRKYDNSSLLYDIIDGEKQIIEMIDYTPISTRAGNF